MDLQPVEAMRSEIGKAMRLAAVRALGAIGTPDARTALERLRDDGTPDVRPAVLQALG
jgi:HEAT repeat protein